MRRFLVPFAVVITLACSSGDKSAQETPPSDAPAAEAVQAPPIAVASATRNVACGCAVEGIGACGNYVEIDGKYYYIANGPDLGLGAMEWCGKDGVTAESSGEIRDGQFFAATLVVTTP